MPPPDDSPLDRAEALARRLLDRLGSKLERKSPSEPEKRLTTRQIGDLVAQLERVIEAALRTGPDGQRNLAPARFKVLLTYEETSVISQQYMKAVAEELTDEVREYIANRRYKAPGVIVVEVDRDLFAQSTTIKSAFDGSPGSPGEHPASQPAPQSKSIGLRLNDSVFHLELRVAGEPLQIGRAAGSAVRIDDSSVSRAHCSIALKPDGSIVLSDLGSANGTRINGRQLQSYENCAIKANDAISVGDVTLEVIDRQ
jgi:hypothetical protein